MTRRPSLPATVAARAIVDDGSTVIPALIERIRAAGGVVRTLSTVRRLAADAAEGDAHPDEAAPVESLLTGRVEIEIEVEGLDEERLVRTVHATPGVQAHRLTRALDRIFGKRVIVIGAGAQVAQVALGAVSEADRHNLRGERISVDTIALVGEKDIAAAVRAVADLPRARLLVLAGSIMGGEITAAARELREQGIPIICLNMVGSITEVADLVVSDPVQAGTMAVMAVADTATFDLARQRGRRY
jgi:energy-converting hydrogenase B subunit Q